MRRRKKRLNEKAKIRIGEKRLKNGK